MPSTPRLLAATCHLGPTVLVTGLATALAAGRGQPPRRVALISAAVLAGQLTIGWSNDLLDADRDRRAGRLDKPLALDPTARRPVLLALGAAGGACLLLSGRCGGRAGLVHVVLVVGSGWAYNAGLKRSTASILPYAVAFGGLPHVVTLADRRDPAPAAAWQTAAGALLGSAAHLLNALPDLRDDAATGVHGYPHRWSERALRAQSAAALAGAQLAVLRGVRLPVIGRVGLAAVAVALSVGVTRGSGEVPFWCAGLMAATDAAVWVAAQRTSDAARS
ncbi:UbiA family prenyltransferase [Arsenicicoccus dermatophilus]|uniref:UbiA family prenyltransferase n=1 Tax=Arsenicicoccus dermatophilus TaxID=1076331 RepID=UPI00391728A0